MNTIAQLIDGKDIEEVKISGKVEYDPSTKIFIFEDGSKAEMVSKVFGINGIKKYWKEVV